MKEDTLSLIWREYEQGKKYAEEINLYTQTERNYRFYEGDQWYNLELKSSLPYPPIYNFISGVVDIKVANICVNKMTVTYSSQNYTADGEERETLIHTCDHLTDFFRQKWEIMKMDTKNWNDCKDSAVAGDSYRYFFNEGNSSTAVMNTNIILADDKQEDIQEQSYIIIVERVLLDDVRRIAKGNKVDIDDIISNPLENELDLGDRKEKPSDKVTSLLKMWKEDGKVWFCRASKDVVYEPKQSTEMTLYPVVSLNLFPKQWSNRGIGCVKPLLNNQIALNRIYANRLITVQHSAFPKPVMLEGRIKNPGEIYDVGSAMLVNGNSAEDISGVVKYLQPASASPDARFMSNELLEITRDLSQTGKAVTGDFNPERASGAAIIAVRDMAMLPSNKQIQIFQQYIEDIALILMDMWRAYNPNGFSFVPSDSTEVVRVETPDLENLNLSVRVDVSSDNPLSKMAREQNLLNLHQMGFFTTEEMVELLDKNSNFDKSALQRLMEKRKLKNITVLGGQEIPLNQPMENPIEDQQVPTVPNMEEIYGMPEMQE